MRTAAIERADVIAFLQQRLANCAVMEGKSPEFAEAARERARQLRVIIDELAAGLHEGDAAKGSDLSALQAPAAASAASASAPRGATPGRPCGPDGAELGVL